MMLAISFFSLAKAEALTDSLDALGNKIQGVQNTINEIPTTPEGISDKYLKQEWSKMIIENKIYGPVHKFLLNNQFAFRTFLNEDYAFSVTFLLTLIIWVFLMTISSDMLYSSGLLKRFSSLVFGFCVSVIVARIGTIKQGVFFLIYFFLSKGAWWVRLLAWLAFFAILIYFGYFLHTIAKSLAEKKKKRGEAEKEFKLKKTEAFIEGVEKGQELGKKIVPVSRGNVKFRKSYG